MTPFTGRVAAIRPRRRFLQGLLSAATSLCLPMARSAPLGQYANGNPVSPTSSATLSAEARTVAASVHFPFGPVVPALALPPWPLRTHEGTLIESNALFKGRVTALQLMFTGCSATCPIQGAIFAAAQRQLGASAGDAQFVSLSIDPLADNPAALSEWLKRFDALPGWIAAAPRRADLEQIRAQLRGDNVGSNGTEPRPTDSHSAQVYLIDRQARLVHRSADFPPVEKIVENLRRLRDHA